VKRGLAAWGRQRPLDRVEGGGPDGDADQGWELEPLLFRSASSAAERRLNANSVSPADSASIAFRLAWLGNITTAARPGRLMMTCQISAVAGFA
jgi:hypothetical protein